MLLFVCFVHAVAVCYFTLLILAPLLLTNPYLLVFCFTCMF